MFLNFIYECAKRKQVSCYWFCVVDIWTKTCCRWSMLPAINSSCHLADSFVNEPHELCRCLWNTYRIIAEKLSKFTSKLSPSNFRIRNLNLPRPTVSSFCILIKIWNMLWCWNVANDKVVTPSVVQLLNCANVFGLTINLFLNMFCVVVYNTYRLILIILIANLMIKLKNSSNESIPW